MPSTKTITASDFNVFASGGTIRSAEMNTNFDLTRGHILPMDASLTAASDLDYDLGDSTHRWNLIFGTPVVNLTQSAAPVEGEFGWITGSNQLEYYNGSSWVTFLDANSAQTLTNKEIVAPTITGGHIDFTTATSTNKLLLPRETTTALDALADSASSLAYDETLSLPVFNNGSGWKPLVDLTSAQTLSSKELTSPLINTPTISGGDINLGTASNTNRLLLANETTTALDALTDVEGLLAYDKTLQAPVFNNGAGWAQISGTGGGGAKSWLESPDSDAESASHNWTTYDDGATASAVDGSGASAPGLAITRTTTTGEVLAGTTSFKIAKSAADCKGEGVAVDFTIDYVEQGKAQQLPFAIKSGSGFQNSYFKAQVIDVSTTTGSVLNVFTMDGGTGELYATPDTGSKFSGLFYPETSSTSYRMVLHCQTTGTQSFNFFIDEIKPGPLSKVSGYNQEPIKTFTPTINNISGTKTGYWYREGQHAIIHWGIEPSGAATGIIDFEIPSELQAAGIDTSALVPSAGVKFVEGRGSFYDQTANTGFVGWPYAADTKSIYIYGPDNTGAWGASTPVTAGSTDDINVWVKVPISGWNASDTMSVHQADLRTLKVQAELSTSSHSTSSNWETVSWTESEDTHNAFDGTTFTAPFTGDFIISSCLSYAANATGYRTIQAVYSGGNDIRGVGFEGSNAAQTSIVNLPSIVLRMTKGETISIQGFQTSGGSLNYTTSQSRLSITGYPDFSAFAVQGVHEYKEVVLSANTATTGAAGNEVDVTGATLTLGPGTWQIGYDALLYQQWVSVTQSSAGRIQILDSSNNDVTGSSSVYFCGSMSSTAESRIIPMSKQTEITITSEETYNLTVTNSRADTEAVSTVWSIDGVGGTMSSPTGRTIFWARRVK